MKLPAWLRGRAARWAGVPLVLVLLVATSLEEVTDDPPPLDPRFVAGGGASAVGPGPGLVPFSDYDGDTVKLKGVVVADAAAALDLDLWQVDPSAPGSRTHLGKIPVAGAGPFELDVPVDFGTLQLESFVDQTGDGPSMDDPFGRTECDIGGTDVNGVELVLEPGGMANHHGGPPPAGGSGAASGGPDHVEMPPGGDGGEQHEHRDAEPGAPGGGEHVHVEMPPGGLEPGDEQSAPERPHLEAGPGAPGGGEHEHVEAPPGTPGGGGEHVHIPDAKPEGAAPGASHDPFSGTEGPRVVLSGVIHYAKADAILDMDIFEADSGGPGGRAFVGKQKLSPGPFELPIPKSFGNVTLEVFHDATGDGPSSDDPFVACPCNPVNLRRGDVDDIEIRLEGSR